MSDAIQDIARQLGVQTFGEGLLSKIRQTIDLLQEAAAEREQLKSELAAIKAQEPVQVDYVAVMRADGDGGLEVEWLLEGGTAELMNGMYLCCVGSGTLLFEEGSGHLYAAPVSEAKAQGEHGDAYQGAREDLAIWKRRALEAEEKVRHQEQIIDRMGEDLNEINGPTFMGEPVLPTKAQGVVMPERKEFPELMMAEYHEVRGWNSCLDEVARLNAAPVQQVSAPDERIIPISTTIIQWAWEDEPEETRFQEGYNAAKRWVKMQIEASVAAPAAPAADAWIAVSERLPDNGKPVLANYLNSHGKSRTIRAMYVNAWTTEADYLSDPDTECVEYSEQDDCYYLCEGWYELMDNWSYCSSIAVTEGMVTKWTALPAAPKGGSHE